MTFVEQYKGTQRDGNYGRYRILRGYGTRNRGQKPSKLMNTMRNLDVGDAFFYPYPSISSVFRSAKQFNIKVSTEAFDAGFLVVRIA